MMGAEIKGGATFAFHLLGKGSRDAARYIPLLAARGYARPISDLSCCV